MNNFKYGILHNRKTAGTTLQDIIHQQIQRTPSMNLQRFSHAMTLPRFVKEYPHAQAIFFIREPISRFISGFYSRLRQGNPRYHYPWNRAEAKAFIKFSTPNQLAEGLSSLNPLTRRSATSAMRSINHVKHTYVDFLGRPSFLKGTLNRIAFIGHQPDFNIDLTRLRLLLKIDSDIVAPNDDTRAHRNPHNVDKYLSEKAIHNLQKWFQTDFDIYYFCLEIRKELNSKIDLLFGLNSF